MHCRCCQSAVQSSTDSLRPAALMDSNENCPSSCSGKCTVPGIAPTSTSPGSLLNHTEEAHAECAASCGTNGVLHRRRLSEHTDDAAHCGARDSCCSHFGCDAALPSLRHLTVVPVEAHGPVLSHDLRIPASGCLIVTFGGSVCCVHVSRLYSWIKPCNMYLASKAPRLSSQTSSSRDRALQTCPLIVGQGQSSSITQVSQTKC
mmetsp:Transcript_11375/g.34187  ORF Transcript_11375/g.34187 Transcript_11375/m.34187 type:complete len:204 (+) Transcript_11375:741-1352(+)